MIGQATTKEDFTPNTLLEKSIWFSEQLLLENLYMLFFTFLDNGMH